jgi:2-polyprenyl-3-methyl-5-hydroxy-6-metoxy-1,4-benzoquinol methylase
MVDYNEMDQSFYKKVAGSKNLLRHWFHNSRQKIVTNQIDNFYKEGKVIADLGCGNVLWNTKLLPVIGVDINEKFLDYNLTQKTIFKKIISPVENVHMPDESCDIIVLTEVLEHMVNPDFVLKEVYRLLKPGGIIICSVPYDTFFSLWKPLFAIQCFYRGRLLRENYYKEKCGHINNFSPRSIGEIFKQNKFVILKQINHSYLTIFTIAKK